MIRNWSLYNKEEKIRIDDLSVEQIHTILLAIASNRMGDWFACQEGDLRWTNICDLAEFYEDTHQAKGEGYLAKPQAAQPTPAQSAPVPERRPLFEEAPDETNHSTLALEAIVSNERRSARRYARKLRFRMQGYEGETKDVSMAGLSLVKALPPETPRQFKAELLFNGQSLGIVCQKVSDHQLKILDSEMWEVLKRWIVSW